MAVKLETATSIRYFNEFRWARKGKPVDGELGEWGQCSGHDDIYAAIQCKERQSAVLTGAMAPQTVLDGLAAGIMAQNRADGSYLEMRVVKSTATIVTEVIDEPTDVK